MLELSPACKAESACSQSETAGKAQELVKQFVVPSYAQR